MKQNEYLNNFMEEAQVELASSTEEQDHKGLGSTTLIVLVTWGLFQLLPELKEWLKLGVSALALKRQEIEKRLEAYAAKKELDMDEARKAAKVVAKKVTESDVKQLVQALEESQEDEDTN